jgi:cell division protein FtsB
MSGDSRAEETIPWHDPEHPAVKYERRRKVDRELKRLRQQFIFLFVLLVASMVLVTISQQLNANRIEYARYDLCIQRQAEIEAYNQQNQGKVPPFPVASCGADPRTD